jgi:hypothetical protein
MKIEFSVHAVKQLQVRSRISKSMVLDALRDPDEILQSYRDRQLYRKRYGEEQLEIVIVQEDNKLVVITQYYLEQPL